MEIYVILGILKEAKILWASEKNFNRVKSELHYISSQNRIRLTNSEEESWKGKTLTVYIYFISQFKSSRSHPWLRI